MTGEQGPSHFGWRLRRAREVVGATQPELAAAIGLKRIATMTDWEQSAECRVGGEYLIALSLALGVSLDWLAHGPATSTAAARRAADAYRRLAAHKPGPNKKAEGE